MKETIGFDELFALFREGGAIDETVFRFRGEAAKVERYIGFISGNELPYWAGLCDIDGGAEFATADELFAAPIYGGRSLTDLRDEIELVGIAGLSVEEYIEYILKK